MEISVSKIFEPSFVILIFQINGKRRKLQNFGQERRAKPVPFFEQVVRSKLDISIRKRNVEHFSPSPVEVLFDCPTHRHSRMSMVPQWTVHVVKADLLEYISGTLKIFIETLSNIFNRPRSCFFLTVRKSVLLDFLDDLNVAKKTIN